MAPCTSGAMGALTRLRAHRRELSPQVSFSGENLELMSRAATSSLEADDGGLETRLSTGVAAAGGTTHESRPASLDGPLRSAGDPSSLSQEGRPCSTALPSHQPEQQQLPPLGATSSVSSVAVGPGRPPRNLSWAALNRELEARQAAGGGGGGASSAGGSIVPDGGNRHGNTAGGGARRPRNLSWKALNDELARHNVALPKPGASAQARSSAHSIHGSEGASSAVAGDRTRVRSFRTGGTGAGECG